MCTPNLFSFATKELSQDAMICWLIAWALTEPNSKCGHQLRDLGRAFVDALLAKHDASLQGDIQCSECPEAREIHQQDRGIDVLARIRGKDAEHVLVIEDKVHGHADASTLMRYYQNAIEGTTKLGPVDKANVRAIFLKTGNQSCARDNTPQEACFKLFHRQDFLKILKTYQGVHPVVTDFRKHLQAREDDFISFRNWRRDDEERQRWPWGAWEGLYRRLEREIEDCDRFDFTWGYVPRGNFLGFWWHRVPIELEGAECIYLQLEVKPTNPSSQKFCFKVKAGEHTDNDRRSMIRDRCRAEILATGDDLVRSAPKRVGRHMTVAVWTRDWLAFNGDGSFSLKGTVANLRQAEQIIDAAARNL